MPDQFQWQKALRGADDLSPVELRVLFIISTYTDENLMNAYPSLATIMADACLSEKPARRARAALIEKGYLQVTEHGGNQHGKGRANVYRLLFTEGMLSRLEEQKQSSTRVVSATTLDYPQGWSEEPAKGGQRDPSRVVSVTTPSVPRSVPGSARARSARASDPGSSRQQRTDRMFDAAMERARARDLAAEQRAAACEVCGRRREICERAEAAAGANGHRFSPGLEATA